ncbi:MAG: AAA family ATPase [Candidatus Moranbacteria bacterium]|nr:AAA family ATPase [Candidatus Moranbacteria bacterium]
MRKIIAILGLPGAGKTEVINYLIKKYNWPKVYFGDVTFDEVKRRGLEINEKNERTVREDLRAKYGRLHYASQVIKKIEALPSDTNVLVESLYDWREYLFFKEKFGKEFMTIATYASPETRYERLSKRPERPLTPEVAQSRDYAQIENLFQAGPIAMANYTINNEGTFEELYSQVDEIIENINK